MKCFFFFEVFLEMECFNILENIFKIIKKYMYIVFKNNGYDENDFYDSYGKFFLYGDVKECIL